MPTTLPDFEKLASGASARSPRVVALRYDARAPEGEPLDPSHWRVALEPPVSPRLLRDAGFDEPAELFERREPLSELALSEYLSNLALGVFAGFGPAWSRANADPPWQRHVRDLLRRFDGEPPQPSKRTEPANEAFLAFRRDMVLAPPLSEEMVNQLSNPQPKLFLGDHRALRLRRAWDGTRPVSPKDVIEPISLREPPFIRTMAQTVQAWLESSAEQRSEADDRAWLTCRARERPIIHGTGPYEGFSVTLFNVHRPRISFHAGPCFFQETRPGTVALFPSLEVYLECDGAEPVAGPASLPVFVNALPDIPDGLLADLSAALRRPAHVSAISAHAFVGSKYQMCLGTTGSRYRQRVAYPTVLDALLQSHLRAGARVLRYGWHKRNTSRVFNNPNGENTPTGLYLMPLSAAQACAARHPEVEIVPWDR